MALSNYASAIVDTEGKTVAGIQMPDNFGFEVYKDWVYVANAGAWAYSQLGYTEPIIGALYKGKMMLGGSIITMARDANDTATFIAIEYRRLVGGVKVWRGIAGIARYAYEGDQHVGITQANRDEFVAWLKSENLVDWLPILDRVQFLQYNQGDMYLSQAYGQDTQVAPVGELPPPTILSQIVEKMREDNNDTLKGAS